MTYVADVLHRLAHWLDPQACRCQLGAWMRGWGARRDMEIRRIGLPQSPDELDTWFRRVIADGEREVAP